MLSIYVVEQLFMQSSPSIDAVRTIRTVGLPDNDFITKIFTLLSDFHTSSPLEVKERFHLASEEPRPGFQRVKLSV